MSQVVHLFKSYRHIFYLNFCSKVRISFDQINSSILIFFLNKWKRALFSVGLARSPFPRPAQRATLLRPNAVTPPGPARQSLASHHQPGPAPIPCRMGVMSRVTCASCHHVLPPLALLQPPQLGPLRHMRQAAASPARRSPMPPPPFFPSMRYREPSGIKVVGVVPHFLSSSP
jgi:hypothetical protein